MGCGERNKVVWTGSEGFNFNGVELELPNNGKGQYGATAKQLDYQWEGKALTIRDLGDDTVSVTTPLVIDQIVDKTFVIVIDSAGNITTRKPKDTDENQKPQQDADDQLPARAESKAE